MSTLPKRICLVSSLHLSFNPRLLKEADALHEAGYAVRVVAMRLESAKAAWDRQLMSTRGWQLETLDACRDNLIGRLTWLKGSLRHRFYQRSARLQGRGTGLEKTFSRYFPEMCCLAAREPADLFIGHNLQALPPAAYAAQRCQAKLGFDAEDFHRGEIPEDDAQKAPLRKAIIAIEQSYIPRCDYLTAASDGIGDAYARVLGVPKPATILNVFPLSEREGHTPPEELRKERCGPGLSLYWYSQVIGPDRGLQDVLQALALLPTGVRLHIRGAWAHGYKSQFHEQADALGVADRLHVLPTVPPEQLVERAAQHDVGLALEAGHTENRRIAVTNKFLNYYLAGLAIAASDVPGQRAIMKTAPEAGFLFKPGDAQALANHLRAWLECPETLKAAKERSRCLGKSRFCWDHEKLRLLKAVLEVCSPLRLDQDFVSE